MAKKKPNAKLESCTCCAILHDPRFCSQCIAAGCNHKIRNERCRQDPSAKALAQVPDWQVREELARLQSDYKTLTAEAQRLMRILLSVDPALLDSGHTQIPPAIDLANSSRQSMAANPSASQGGIPHGG